MQAIKEVEFDLSKGIKFDIKKEIKLSLHIFIFFYLSSFLFKRKIFVSLFLYLNLKKIMGNSENSGVINFGIKEYMNEQFNKVRKNQKRDYLTISEVFS